MLSRAEVKAVLPEAAQSWSGALHTPSDGGAEPERAAPAIAEAARRAGAAIVTSCAARGVERQAGRVSGVVTELAAIACQSVLVAAGAWSLPFTARGENPTQHQFDRKPARRSERRREHLCN